MVSPKKEPAPHSYCGVFNFKNMAKRNLSNFKVWCSEIGSLFSVPQGITMPTKQDMRRYQRLLDGEKELTEDERAFIKKCDDKIAIYKDPPIAKATINSILRQYGWTVYNKKVAASGDQLSFLKKGTDMELEAAELLSRIDKREYKLSNEIIENDYLVGKCDIVCPDKIIDLKISWNVNSFLKARTTKLSFDYWCQVQGYMELWNIDEAEVVFLLLNTPIELIEKEKVKLLNKFMIGEIERDRYETEMDSIQSAFTYSNTPLKKRHFRFRIKREPEMFETAYKKIEKARLWVADFERDMKKNIFVVPTGEYFGSKKDNTEHNPNVPGEGDTGGSDILSDSEGQATTKRVKKVRKT